MKKLFLLIPALVLAIVLNAATTPVSSGVNTLKSAVLDASSGDILELGDGIFYEEGNFDMNKGLTIKAAEGAHPVIANRYFFRVEGGADITFEGIKFDGSAWRNGNDDPIGASDHCIRSHNNSTGEEDVQFIDCEFTGYPSFVIYTQRDARRWNSITINNCTFYNNNRCVIRIDDDGGNHTKQSCNALTIENSTFAGVTTAEDVIYYNAPDAEHTTTLSVNHCTFYGHPKRAIYWQKSENLSVNNCVFSQPSSVSYKSVECVGGTISNCLSYNSAGYSSAATRTDNIVLNPLFVDAEHADYSLRMGSPARGAATDASSLGDPRWSGNLVIESAISTDLVLEPADATRNEYFKLDANLHLKANNPNPATENYGIATWQVHVTREVAVQVQLHINTSSLYGHTYKVEIINASTEAKIGEVAENGWQDVTGEVAFSNPINLSEGTYTVKLSNTCNGSTEAILDDVTLAYAGGNSVNIPGDLAIGDAIHNGEIKDGAIKFADALTGWAKWNIVVANEAFYDVNITIKNQWEHNLTATIYEEDGVTEVGAPSVGNKGTSSTEGHTFRMGGVYLMPGNYVLKVTNARDGSDAKIVGLNLATAGGAVQAVPGATSNSEAWYSNNGTRAEGKISFPTYNGAWVKWNMTAASTGTYNIKLRVDNPTAVAHKFAIHVTKVGEAEGDPIFMETWNETYDADAPLEIECGSFSFEAGAKYVLKVTSGENGTQAKIINVVTSYAGGGTINLSKTTPVSLLPQDAILSDNATIDNDSINFGGHSSAYAKWNVHSDGGYYKFTTNTFNGYAGLGVQCTINIYNAADEENPISTKQSTWKSAYGADSFTSDAVEMPEGNYIVKIQNISGSKGRVMSIVANYEGGAVVNIPNVAIPLAEAIVSSGTTRSESEINFHGDVNEYATWNIQAEEGLYTFTINITGTNYSKMELTVTDSEDNELYKKDLGVSGSGAAVHSGIFMPNGAYVIKVANVNPSADGCVNSISAALADNALILDEMANDNSAIHAVNGQSKQIVLKRSFKGNMYNTICVPFTESSNTQLTNIFGEGYELLVMSSATLDGNELTLNFDADDQLRHGRPYLIKPTKDVKNPVFAAHTIDESTGYNTKECTSADFIGSFIAGEVPAGDQNLFLGPNDLLYFSQNATPIKGMRAYFHVKVPGAAQAIKHARIVKGTQVITELNLVDDDNKAVKTIENGQLIITIDGVRYNVMGAKIQ